MRISRHLDEIERLWPKPGQTPSKDILEMCTTAVTEHPDSSTLWYDLGILMQRCGDESGYTPENYRHCFENAVKCDFRNWEAHQELGYVIDIYYDDYERAKQAFNAAIECGAGSESYYGLARVLAQMGKTYDAVHWLSEGVCPFHNHPDIQKLRDDILAGKWCWNSG
jgi:hypothetical protein